MNKKIFIISLLASFVFFSFLSSALAQNQDQIISPLNQGNTESPVDNFSQIQTILISVINWVYTLFFFVAILFILLAAYNYIFGGMQEERIKKAKHQLLYAVIAIAIALIASGVSLVIKSFIEGAAN